MTYARTFYLLAILPACVNSSPTLDWSRSQQGSKVASKPASRPSSEAPFVAYTETIPGTGIHFDLVPIRAGKFLLGSPETEPGRSKDEGPQRAVEVDAFWMGKCEVTWNEYELWQLDLDIQRRQVEKRAPGPRDAEADAITRPTKPYADMSFGMGQDGFPAICMTQLAAKYYCEWLSAKTGHYYRLPTEAEWEYACRAGTKTAYSFGDDPAKLGDYAWYGDNAEEGYRKVGTKKPNPWGLYDMHGNVSEWTLDGYAKDAYAKLAGGVHEPFSKPTTLYPRVVRGGSWQDDADWLRSAKRIASDPDWKMQDPQIPQSIWYHTDAQFLGFRVIRPQHEPSQAEKDRLSALTAAERKEIAERQR